MVLSLTLISTSLAFLLGLVHDFTEDPIAKTQLNKKIKAISEVVPVFSNNPNAEMFKLPTENGDSLEIYPAKNRDQVVGYAVNTYTMRGFNGEIDLMVGFHPDGSIFNITVLKHAETPGLGSKMTTSEFKDQFKAKNPSSFTLKVKKDGGDVDAITAATISSRAFSDAVLRAYNTLFVNGLNANPKATDNTTNN